MSSTPRYWLSIDCGGTYIKSGLYDQNAREVGIERQPLVTLTPSSGYAERDMHELWQRCATTISRLLDRYPSAAQHIAGIGLSAQGKGLFLLDRENQPLGNGILSSDRRAAEVVAEWQQQGIAQQLYPLTRQALWTGHPVSLLRWIKQHQPQRYQNIGCVMMAHDFLRWKLTGEKGAELSNISESNLYNMRTGTYDPQLTRLTGISEMDGCLPPIVGSADICGYVSETAAKVTGLAVGTPVSGGLFDVASVAICAGIRDESALNAVMGTWAVTTGIAHELRDHEQHNYVYGHYVEPGQYIVHEASPTSSANLEWVKDQLNISDFDQMNTLVASLPAADSELFFLPFLYGSNAGPDIAAGFYGLRAHHTKAHLLQAVFEGVVFSHMTHISRMAERFPQAKILRVTGGPTRSPIWMQILADVSGMPLELPRVEETGCFGAAIIAMVSTGHFLDVATAQQHIQPDLRQVKPNRDLQEKYHKKYQRYQLLTQVLQGYHNRIKEQNL
ncbi:FGGY-family carbohydrate kinase [Tatumella citrea]|uniref:Carbohydrate kinase n=1 Tax=Tatumella citrea TaxID=53336 RepID=A0A1Y0L437_TATCI|nr:FGGY-family carbohydrate kinase [Tatumella citrea]ARU92774.1 carbohydrate kinase [Tatumella citrea]ARU96812.1 carbohydrate kinase [Tatumella citrea]